MSTWMWFAIGVYAAGAAFTFHHAGGRVAWASASYQSHLDGSDILAGLFVGLMSAIVWPVALTVIGVRSTGWSFTEAFTGGVERVLYTPPDKRKGAA